MSSLNKALIIGHLGADPETRYASSGATVTNIRVATTEKWKDKSSGETKEKTEWHRVVAFNRLAEIMAEYLRKGSLVYVEGTIETSTYEKDGEKRYSTQIVARQIQMLGGKGGRREEPRDAPAKAKQPDQLPADFDDEIPF